MPTPTSQGIVSQVELTTYNEINSLIIGHKWGGVTGTGVNLTYSFGDSASSRYISRNANNPFNSNTRYANHDEPFSGFNSLTNAQKIAARNSFDAWSEIANINFVEVIDSLTVAGDIRLARTSASNPAHAYPPGSEPEAGDIWFGESPGFNDVSESTYGYATFLHETGHSLGLAHPHDLNNGEIANINIDSTKYSIMSYRSYLGQPLDSGTGYAQTFFPNQH